MPPEHRTAWRELYEHYVFQTGGDPMEAIAAPHRQSDQPADSAQLASLAKALRELLG